MILMIVVEQTWMFPMNEVDTYLISVEHTWMVLPMIWIWFWLNKPGWIMIVIEQDLGSQWFEIGTTLREKQLWNWTDFGWANHDGAPSKLKWVLTMLINWSWIKSRWSCWLYTWVLTTFI